MLDIHLEIQPQTAQRLRKVLEFYSDQETFAQNIIAYQIAELKKGALNLRLDLRQFEEQYQLSTPDFYHRFSQGALEDSEDFMVWAGLCEMMRENERRLQELE
jgi:chromosome segregation and condensation protein ScpB